MGIYYYGHINDEDITIRSIDLYADASKRSNKSEPVVCLWSEVCSASTQGQIFINDQGCLCSSTLTQCTQ